MSATESQALMAREIAAQPEILTAAIDPLLEAAAALTPPGPRQTWVFGCGDGLYAGESLTRVASILGVRLRPLSAAAMLWEVTPGRGDLAVGVSISGGTARTVEALERAREAGASTLALTVKPESSLGRAAEAVLTLPYEPISRKTPHSLDHTMTLLALAALMGAPRASLEAAIAALAEALDAMTEAAARIPHEGRFHFLGCGGALGAARYGAAKMHEAGGLPAAAEEGENVAHGALFTMRPGDHAVLLGDGGPGDQRTRALRPGLERLGLGVSEAGFDRTPLVAAFETALWCQVLCLAVARAKGLDVTRPGGDGPAAAVQADWFAWRDRP